MFDTLDSGYKRKPEQKQTTETTKKNRSFDPFDIFIKLSLFFAIVGIIFAIIREVLGECSDDTPCLVFGAVCDLATRTCNTTETIPRNITFGVLTLVFVCLSLLSCCIHFCPKFPSYLKEKKKKDKEKKEKQLQELAAKLLSGANKDY